MSVSVPLDICIPVAPGGMAVSILRAIENNSSLVTLGPPLKLLGREIEFDIAPVQSIEIPSED